MADAVGAIGGGINPFTFEIFQCTALATFALVTFEYLITLDDEVRYLWRRRFTFGRFLLFLCRYLPFSSIIEVYLCIITTNFSTSSCLVVARAQTYFTWASFLLTILVLFVRSYAVYGGGRKIFVVLALTFAGAITGTAFFLPHFFKGLIVLPIHTSHGCELLPESDSPWVLLTGSLCCEILSLAILLSNLSLASTREMRNFQSGSTRQSMLQVMLRDGIVYFVFTVAVTIANLVVVISIKSTLRASLLVMQGELQNIMCSRLLFHIFIVNETPLVSMPSSANISRPFSTLEIAPPRSTVLPTDTVGTDDGMEISEVHHGKPLPEEHASIQV